MAKDEYLRNILGNSVFDEIRQTKVLLVGAGGIGCELLKNLVLMGYGEIHIVDLDTIDLSNLNRQFLFRHKDIKKPKATTAVNAVQQFNFHNSKLVAYMANIMDTTQFPLLWFDQFKFIFNALDNIQARSYVNKMCLFLKKPSIESGTTGFNGQVTPIFPYDTECYECTVKETPKTYPVCTIRSTPSQPVHCVTWAKNYLFGQLFGEEEEENPQNLDNLGTDNQDEIKNLIKEHNELQELKTSVADDDFFEKIIEKIFIKDVEKLLSIEDLWKSRKRPIPLQWNDKLKDTVLDGVTITDESVKKGQEVWPIENYVYLLIKSIKSLQKRIKDSPEDPYLDFDKDDEDTLDFVVAASNIRSHMFHIPLKSKFDIKQIAGNIIPAIATTNSIISGYSALQSIFMFKPQPRQESSMVYTFQDTTRLMSASTLYEANSKCKSCSIPRAIIKLNLQNDKVTLGKLVETLVKKLHYDHEDISVILGHDKLLYDPDFDDNKPVPINKLGFAAGLTFLVNDENDEKKSIEIYVEEISEGEIEFDEVELPDQPPKEQQGESPEQETANGDVATTAAELGNAPGDEPILLADDEDDSNAAIEIVDAEEFNKKASKKHKLDDEIAATTAANGGASEEGPAKKQQKTVVDEKEKQGKKEDEGDEIYVID